MQDNQALYVIVDATVFENYQFNFQHPSLQSLMKLSNSTIVKPIMLTVMEKQIRNRIKLKVKKAHEEIQLFQDYAFLKKIYHFNTASADEWTLQNFQDYVVSSRIEFIQGAEVDSQQLFDFYFENFVQTENNFHTFLNAYSCLAIQDFIKQSENKTHIVTDDQEVRKFFEKNEHCVLWKNLEDFLNFINEKMEYVNHYNQIIDYLNNNEEKIIQSIKEELSEKLNDDDLILSKHFGGHVLNFKILELNPVSYNVLPSLSGEYQNSEEEVVVSLLFDTKLEFDIAVGKMPNMSNAEIKIKESYKSLNRNYRISAFISLDTENFENITISMIEINDFID